MRHIFKLTIVPLLSLFLFTLGSGLFTTLLTVRMHLAGASALYIGSLTGVYYAGLAYGSFRIEKYILNVGHVRAFSAFASFIVVISIVQGIYLNHVLWLILRFLGGFCTAGVFVVIESWLLTLGTAKIRGQILALYMIGIYAAQALGQFMINLASPADLMLYAITAILSSLSVIPVALVKIATPEISEPSTLSFKKLFQNSGSAVVGSFSSGLVLGSIYGLLPLVVLQKTGHASSVALFMALIIFGGMFLQYPVGRISDFVERRLVLLFLSVASAFIAFGLVIGFHYLYLSYVLIFLLGGMTFTLYPVSISLACDNMEQKDIVSGTQGMLLAYSIGAVIGPFISPFFIHFLRSDGLFIYLIAINVILSAFLIWRKSSVKAVAPEEQFVVMPNTSPVTAELDPRAEVDIGAQ